MQKVINNLLSNAVKHTKAEDSITLSIKTEGSNAVIRVTEDVYKRQVLSYKRRGKKQEATGYARKGEGKICLTLFICSHSPLKGR